MVRERGIFSLSGKRVVVTGGSGHLGKSIVGALLSDDAIVYAVDLREQVLLESFGSQVEQERLFLLSCDLEVETERTLLVSRINKLTASIDGIVHCAALVGTSQLQGWAVPFESQSSVTFRRAIEVNLVAPFHLTQLLAPLLREAGNASVVGIGSVYGSVGPDWSLYDGLEMSNPAAYGSSKAGLRQLVNWLATTLAPSVRVNLISPGGIYRGQTEEFLARYLRKTPLGRMASEEDIIGAVLFFLSDASSYITGQNLLVDGGFTAL